MRFSFFLSLLLCSCAGLAAGGEQKNPSTLDGASTNALLPSYFSGWEKSAGTAPATSSSDAAVLKEYGLQSAESATYQRGDRNIQVKALRFVDATGAYGAFTFYRTPEMAKENFCDQGASADKHVLFYCSNVLVDVTLDKVTAMTPAELRDLATAIPRITGNLAELPKLPLYLQQSSRLNSHYIAGPAGLNQLNALLKAQGNSSVSSDFIDFSFSPEVVVARDGTLDGVATLVLVQYPTPKIAQAQLQKMNDWAKSQSVDWTKTQAISRTSAEPGSAPNRFATRRSGPLVAIVTGQIAESDARKILSDINYDAEVTWSEATGNNPKDNIGNLVVNIMYLSFIIVGFMFVLGFAFGGFRVFAKKFFPGRLIDRPEDVDFIKLNLRD